MHDTAAELFTTYQKFPSDAKKSCLRGSEDQPRYIVAGSH